jgi:5-dehydro-2-deoxygluconokinase
MVPTHWPAPPGVAGGWVGRWSCRARVRCVSTVPLHRQRPGHWPTEQVVKCLVHYHPDDASTCGWNRNKRCWSCGRPPAPAAMSCCWRSSAPGLHQPGPTTAVLRAVKRFYNLGIKPEWWKLAPMQTSGWQAPGALVTERDPHCRGAVILGLNQPWHAGGQLSQGRPIQHRQGLHGRAQLWADASVRWLAGEMDDAALVSDVAVTSLFWCWPGATGAPDPRPS